MELTLRAGCWIKFCKWLAKVKCPYNYYKLKTAGSVSSAKTLKITNQGLACRLHVFSSHIYPSNRGKRKVYWWQFEEHGITIVSCRFRSCAVLRLHMAHAYASRK